MKNVNIAMVIVGVAVILFAAFCPLAEVHTAVWRITIGLVGGFSLVSGMYKIVCRE